MWKKLAVIFVAFLIGYAALGGNQSPKQTTADERIQSIEKASQPVVPTTPVAEEKLVTKELTPEEIAEQKRFEEEKRVAELENSRQKAVESKKHLEEKLAAREAARVLVEEFDARFVENLGVSSMGVPTEERSDAIIYPLDATGEVYMSELLTPTGKLRGVNIFVKAIRQDTVFTALVFYKAAIQAFTPYPNVNAVFKGLSLDATLVENLTKPQETTINGITYTKKITAKTLVLGITEQ